MPSHDADEDVTAGTAAALLGVTRQQVHRLAVGGKLPARQVAGRYWVFRRGDVLRYKAQPKSKGGRPRKPSRRDADPADDPGVNEGGRKE